MTLEVISREEAREKGLKRYFTGLPCNKAGHIAERFVSNRTCCSCTSWSALTPEAKEKNKMRAARWAKKNPDKAQRHYDKTKDAIYYQTRKWTKILYKGARLQSETLMDLQDAVDIFKAQDNAFDYVEELDK